MKTNLIKNSKYCFIIVVCCCLLMGVNVGIAFSCAGIFYVPVSESIGVSVGKFGIYMSIMYVASTLMLSYAGVMMEKYSARKLLTLNSALMGVTLIWMAFSRHLWQFYVAGAVLGITMAFLLYLGFPTLINRWFSSKVGLMIGICSAASGIGGMIFNPIGARIIESFGWNYAYLTFAAIVLLIETPILYFLLRDKPSDIGTIPYSDKSEKKKNVDNTLGISYKQSLKMPVLYALVLFSFFLMACSTLNLYIPKYVTDLEFTLSQASFAAAAVMAGVTIGKLILGSINDWNCLVGVLFTTLGGACGLVLIILGSHALWLILTGAFLFGFEYAGVTVQTTMITRKVFGNKDYAKIYAVISIALAVGGAVASGIWGFIIEHTSFTFIFLIGIAMMIACSLIGVMSLVTKTPSYKKC